MNRKIRLAELFCGAGGIGLGASLARVDGLRIEHVWATDYDKDACDTYRKNLHPEEVVHSDIRKLDFESLKKSTATLIALHLVSLAMTSVASENRKVSMARSAHYTNTV